MIKNNNKGKKYMKYSENKGLHLPNSVTPTVLQSKLK